MKENNESIAYEDFLKVKMCTGTILKAQPNVKAKKPAYILTIDFGDLGTKISSAQITKNYTCEQLIGMQIIAIVNFLPKKVAGVNSEVLVLGSVSEQEDIVLLQPTMKVPNGSKIG